MLTYSTFALFFNHKGAEGEKVFCATCLLIRLLRLFLTTKAQKALRFFVRLVYLFAFCAFVVKKSAEGAKVFCATCLPVRLLRLCGKKKRRRC
jgi:hypothetical protein